MNAPEKVLISHPLRILRDSRGRSALDAILGFFAFLLVLPPLVSAAVMLGHSAIGMLASVLATAIPWLGIVVLVAVAGACCAAILASRPDPYHADGSFNLPPPPPIQRPPGGSSRHYDS